MSAPRWYLPTVSEIIALSEQNAPDACWAEDELTVGTQTGSDRPRGLPRQRARAEREWYAAVGAVNDLLRSRLKTSAQSDKKQAVQGVVLSGSAPILEKGDVLSQISAWTFTPGALAEGLGIPIHLLPSARKPGATSSTSATLSLDSEDPLATEQFCVVMTATFSLAMSLGTDADGLPVFLFSFVPDVVQKAWRSLQSRLRLNHSPLLQPLSNLVGKFPPVEPHYRTVTQFQRLMLGHLPDVLDGRSRRRTRLHRLNSMAPILTADSSTNGGTPPNLNDVSNAKLDPVTWDGVMNRGQRKQTKSRTANQKGASTSSSNDACPPKSGLDVELLQALVHEVRTPLTTIRTLTRLLLRRKDLHADVIKRLEMIDRECTEQIDRFNLIFRAVELETKSARTAQTPLAAIALDQIFEQNIPRWQAQASQHSLTLDVSRPQKLPMVVSDPTMLEQVLTGLIDRITHTLPGGSHIQIEVTLAGHQLKLQFQAESQDKDSPADFLSGLSSYFAPTLKSIGDLLMFQPETGNLSLNLAVTKNLFQALGGKLTVRHRPHQGEILTIFLPLQE